MNSTVVIVFIQKPHWGNVKGLPGDHLVSSLSHQWLMCHFLRPARCVASPESQGPVVMLGHWTFSFGHLGHTHITMPKHLPSCFMCGMSEHLWGSGVLDGPRGGPPRRLSSCWRDGGKVTSDLAPSGWEWGMEHRGDRDEVNSPGRL